MAEERIHEWLMQQVVSISELLKDGRYNEIDLSSIEKEATELARNFGSVITSLESAKGNLTQAYDVPQITDNLLYISRTTTEGVNKVIDFSEAIINDANGISESLGKIKGSHSDQTAAVQPIVDMENRLANLQNNAFTIMASLEFEDINRQLIEKILKKLNELYENLVKVLVMLKFKDKIEKNDSAFLNDMKKVADIEGNLTHKQDSIDQLLKEFGL